MSHQTSGRGARGERAAGMMRKWLVAAVFFGSVGLEASAAEPAHLLLDRAVESRWIQCGIVGGRITLRTARIGGIRSTNQRSGVKESLDVQNAGGQPALRYQRTAGDEQFEIDVKAATQEASIRRLPRGQAAFASVEFVQAADGGVALAVVGDSGRQEHRAQDIWRLLLAQPEACKRHLLPLLESLRPDWKLAEAAAEIEAALLDTVDIQANEARWDALIAQLGDERFTRREAADREFRAGGVAALGYLKRLDLGRLDAEQRFRVRRIVESLDSLENDDSPEQVAASMADDPGVWLLLLSRLERSVRQTAAQRLVALLGEPIPVDPAAAPEMQKTQREQLQKRLLAVERRKGSK